jgi:hypothetical protein
MTRDLNVTENLSDPDVKFLQDVQKFGWHITTVAPRKGDDGSIWTYTTGLFHSFGHPEVILIGLSLKSCSSIVNYIGQLVKEGKKFEPDKLYDDIAANSYQVTFREVRRSDYADYVNYSLWFYERDPFPLLQCIWPDEHHRFPWDQGASESFRNAQPLLSE